MRSTPEYRLRRRRLPYRPLSGRPERWRWIGAAVGLLMTFGMMAALAWLVASGTGRQRWVFQPASPTPRPTTALGVPTATPRPLSPVEQGKPGTIAGWLSFTDGTLPPMRICAEPVRNTAVSYCIEQPAGAGAAYQLMVPAGQYYVYASLLAPQAGFSADYRAYYDQSATCQRQTGCPSPREPVTVPVQPGQEISNVNPGGWYRN